MTGRLGAFEPHPGGRFEMTLTYRSLAAGRGKTSSDSDLVRGHFVDLVSDQRIVQRLAFQSEDPALAGAMTVTWTFAAVPYGTEVTVLCADVPPGVRPHDHADGLRASLDNLAAYVERRPRFTAR